MNVPSLVALAVAASLTAGAASAAELDLGQTFKAICDSHRLNPTAAIAAARARGFAIETGPEAAKVGTTTQLSRTENGRRWIVRVAVTGVPPSVTQAGQTSSTCSVGGQALGPTAGDSLKVWAGVPPLDPNAAQAVYAFREVAGRHQPLVSNDDAGVKAAMQAGGVYMFQVKTTNGNTVATLSRTVASAF